MDSVLDFTRKLELEFEELAPGTLTPQSDFKNAFYWNSINALIVMAFIASEYEVEIKVEELQKCADIQALYDLVIGKPVIK